MNEKLPPQNDREQTRELRQNITVGRSARRKDGSRVKSIDGQPIYRGYESGWDEIKVYVNENGVEISVVGKQGVDPRTGQEGFLTKRIPTAELDHIQQMVRNTENEKSAEIADDKAVHSAGRAALKLVGVEKPTKNAEQEYRQRLEYLARPLKTNMAGELVGDKADAEQGNDYDDLFNPDVDSESKSVEDAAVRHNKLDKIAPENIEAARKFISGLPQELELVFKRANEGNRPLSRVDIARNNHQVRVELLDALLQIVDQYQIRSNEHKTINHSRSEGKVTSQEATALMALSMLDGSFDGAASREDPIYINGSGQVKLGKHRYAALRALGAHDRTFAKDFVGVER